MSKNELPFVSSIYPQLFQKHFLQEQKKKSPIWKGVGRLKKMDNQKVEEKIREQLKKQNQKIRGQATLEYIIISSLIGIFCLFAMKRIGQVLEKRLNYIKTSITKNLPMDK